MGGSNTNDSKEIPIGGEASTSYKIVSLRKLKKIRILFIDENEESDIDTINMVK